MDQLRIDFDDTKRRSIIFRRAPDWDALIALWWDKWMAGFKFLAWPASWWIAITKKTGKAVFDILSWNNLDHQDIPWWTYRTEDWYTNKLIIEYQKEEWIISITWIDNDTRRTTKLIIDAKTLEQEQKKIIYTLLSWMNKDE